MRLTLVARAVVGYEIGLLAGEGDGVTFPPPLLTVNSIVAKYDLDWGGYPLRYEAMVPMPGDENLGADRAKQLIRNELNRAVHEGRLTRLEERSARCAAYVRTED